MSGAATPLDAAHLRAEETGAEGDRLSFWSRLAEAELHLLAHGEADGAAPPARAARRDDAAARDGTAMRAGGSTQGGAAEDHPAEPTGDAPAPGAGTRGEHGAVVHPHVVDVEGVRYALAFDRAARLAAFADGPAPTVTLSGRRLAALLSEQGVGLALNLPDAPSAQLLPPEALAWLVETLGAAPAEAEASVEEVGPPGALPDALLEALDAKLPAISGMARSAYLASVRYEGGARGHVLGVVDVVPGAEADVARAVQEALALSGLEAGTLDVAFPRRSAPLSAALARHGLRIDLPEPDAPAPRDEDAPPRLR